LCSTAIVMKRERLCEPPPHDMEHVDQSPNRLTAQCTGHGPSSQACVSLWPPHATPPCAAGTVVDRVRV
jgi:hypothetical protein